MMTDHTRRTLLKTGAVVAASAVAATGGFSLVALAGIDDEQGKVSALQRWGLLIDTARCVDGCTTCVDACADEHHLEVTDANAEGWIRAVQLRSLSDQGTVSLPLMCQHCNDAPCVEVCPTGASFQRDDGVVLVNKHTCIGCRYCVIACPYQARSFVFDDLTGQRPWSPRGKGTAEGCTFCVHRIDNGQRPACVEACASDAMGAMTFGDLNDADSEIAQMLAQDRGSAIRADLGTDTAVRYKNL